MTTPIGFRHTAFGAFLACLLSLGRGPDAAAALPCGQVTLVPAAAQIRADGGTGTVRVTAGDGCAWTAASNASWITISNGATGTGKGDLQYTAAATSDAEARTGTLTIGGSTYTLRQAGQRSADITLIRTVQVTPDGNFKGGGFARIYDSPTAGRLLVTFNTPLNQPEGSCVDSAHAYKEYTTDLQETGNKGIISCVGGVDIGSLLVGNSYYLATMHREGDQQGWQITKYDATSWAQQATVFRPVDFPREVDNDPMVAYVNGQLDFSSQYNASGTPADPSPGSFHLFFSPSLQFLGEKKLTDTPNVHGASMLVVDGVTYFVAANAYLGDLVAMKYDASWSYLGARTLVTNGLFSEGLAFDGQRFYVAYLDTTLRTGNGMPLSLNVRLAAFDRDWNLVEDVPVTSFGWADLRQPGRPYLLLHSDRLYVSYDCDTIDPVTHQEQLKGQAFVAVYDITKTSSTCTSFTISPTSASPSAAAGSQQVTLTGSPAGCSGGSWTASGNGSWLTVSPASGTGAGTVTASWTQNTSSSSRTGSATIAGNTFAVNQSGTGGGTCTPGATTLCIANRFQVQVAWSTAQGGGQSGQGHAVATSSIGFSLGGIFWFFDSTNPEMLVKVLNGCSSNNRYWFFASAGTNVELSITVTDVQSGQTKTYTNPDLTAAQPIQDTNALATCP